jgi:dTDP-4-dehydrorhamnose 3,5-epimerase
MSQAPAPRIISLATHGDNRGQLTEIFRQDWPDVPSPVQWNFVHSNANVLRGVHVHVTHSDFLVALTGRIVVGLCDLRKQSGAALAGSVVELSGDNMRALLIPPGVAHGFYFAASTSFVYGMTHRWDPVHDEFGCRWDDPVLGIPWPAECTAPVLSERDTRAGTADELWARLRDSGHGAMLTA